MAGNIQSYLVLIANTISIILLWMMLNIFIGIYLNYAFYEGAPTWKNFVYYAFALVSFLFLLRYVVRKWNRFAQKDKDL